MTSKKTTPTSSAGAGLLYGPPAKRQVPSADKAVAEAMTLASHCRELDASARLKLERAWGHQWYGSAPGGAAEADGTSSRREEVHDSAVKAVEGDPIRLEALVQIELPDKIRDSFRAFNTCRDAIVAVLARDLIPSHAYAQLTEPWRAAFGTQPDKLPSERTMNNPPKDDSSSDSSWLLYGSAPKGSVSESEARLTKQLAELGDLGPWQAFVRENPYGLPLARLIARARKLTIAEGEAMETVDDEERYQHERIDAWSYATTAADEVGLWEAWEAIDDSMDVAVRAAARATRSDPGAGIWSVAVTGAHCAGLAVLTRDEISDEYYLALTRMWRAAIGPELVE